MSENGKNGFRNPNVLAIKIETRYLHRRIWKHGGLTLFFLEKLLKLGIYISYIS